MKNYTLTICLTSVVIVTTVPIRSWALSVPETITSYTEAENIINNEIRTDIEQAMCGGWDTSQSVVGKIPVVTGAPGRNALNDDPFNAIDLGMSMKEDAFFWPAAPTTCGFVSACRSYGGGRLSPSWFADSYGELACQRPLGGYREDEADLPPPNNGAGVRYACGAGQANYKSGANFCADLLASNPTLASPTNGLIRRPGSTTELDETTAGGICQRLNEDWIYTLWRKPYEITDPITGASILLGYTYSKGSCTDYTDTTTLDTAPDGSQVPVSEWEKDPNGPRYCCTDTVLSSALKNCVACSGQDCRSGLKYDNGFDWQSWYASLLEDPYTKHPEERPYESFYRHYTVDVTRDRVEIGELDDDVDKPKVEATKLTDEDDFDDASRLGIPVSCYGPWYWSRGLEDVGEAINPEFTDIKNVLFRCVIGTFFKKDDAADEEQMSFTQAGKGTYYAKHWDTNEPYADPAVEDPDRENASSTNDNNKTWMRDLSRGFSLVWEEVYKKQENHDLTESLLAPDITLQRSTVQRYVPDREDLIDQLDTADGVKAIKDIQLSKGALIRAFDDTVATSNPKRTLVEWWQIIESQMNAYFTIPKVQLLLPPGWAIDLDPEHPFLNPRLPDPDEFSPNPEYQPIEVQLEVKEDLLGEVASYLENSILVEYKPEPISVLVPSGSASEYRALANDWCLWYIEANNASNCNDATGDIGDLIDGLKQYADRIDDSRILRTQASRIITQYLAFQVEVQTVIDGWIIQNTQQFVAWRVEWEERLKLQEKWREIASDYWKFHDEVNQPWCMNQRFTLPIYTLLNEEKTLVDSATPTSETTTSPLSNGHLRDLIGNVLPILPDIKPQAGITFDMSSISIGTGSVLIPVLQPLDIKLNTNYLAAPGLEDRDVTIPTLPELPAIPDFSESLIALVPEVFKPNRTPALFGDVFQLDSYPDIEPELDEIQLVLENINDQYDRFWKSVNIDPEAEDVIDAELDCIRPLGGRCVHAELDIIERITRMFSRPHVYLKEDFESIGTFKNTAPQSCLDPRFDTYKDWVCEQLAPHRTYPSQGYAIGNSSQSSSSSSSSNSSSNSVKEAIEIINELRAKTWLDTVLEEDVDEEDQVPYITPRNDLTPSFKQAPAIDLSPPRFNSNSSNSSNP